MPSFSATWRRRWSSSVVIERRNAGGTPAPREGPHPQIPASSTHYKVKDKKLRLHTKHLQTFSLGARVLVFVSMYSYWISINVCFVICRHYLCHMLTLSLSYANIIFVICWHYLCHMLTLSLLYADINYVICWHYLCHMLTLSLSYANIIFVICWHYLCHMLILSLSYANIIFVIC